MIKFGTDLDDCILNTTKWLKEAAWDKYGVKIPVDSISRYDIIRYCNMNLPTFNTLLDDMYKAVPELNKDVKEVLFEIVKDYYNIKFPLYIITARPHDFVYETFRCLKKYKIDHLFCVFSGKEKYDLINKLGIEIFVEDRFLYAKEIIDNTNCTILLMNKPWNKGREIDDDRFIRINNWFDVLNFVKGVA